MPLPALKIEKEYTYGDYCYWPDIERWELIHGDGKYGRSEVYVRNNKSIVMENSNIKFSIMF